MTPFSGFVLYCVVWFLTLFIILPLRLTTQGEAGHVVPGTPSSAPHAPQMKRRIILTTLVSAVIWAILAAVILSGRFSVTDLDYYLR